MSLRGDLDACRISTSSLLSLVRPGCRDGHDSSPPGVLLPPAPFVLEEVTAGGQPGEIIPQLTSVLTGRDRGDESRLLHQ